MKAVRAVEGRVRVVDVDEPPGAPDGELLTMRSTSICGSDFGYLAAGSSFILGHELAGVREDGTAVAIEAAFGCGHCERCHEGRTNLCPQMAASALGLAADGGMAERFRAPARHLVPLPPGLDVADAALVEPAAVSWHGLRLAGSGPGTRVAVVGGGAVGLLAVAAARAMGAEDVALEARHDRQREAGERLGATTIADRYDVVVEAAGSASALARAVELVGPGGAVVVLGVHHGPVELDFLTLFLNEARFLPSLAYCRHEGGRDMAEAAGMLAAHPEVAHTLVTHRFPLEDAEEAFRVAADRAAGAIKVVLEPSS